MINRGSEWRKWDLHVHTPISFHHEFRFSSDEERQKFHNDIWGKYIDGLEKVLDIVAVGITDYFTIEGYKKVLEYKEAGRLRNFNLILPNIEFRLDKYFGRRRLNYHVIFNDRINTDRIKKEFLEELHVRTETGEQRKLTKENIEEIGKNLKKHQESFRSKSDYTVGCESITVSLNEIIEVLESKGTIFAGNYLLVLPEEQWCLIDWDSQDHLTRKEILVQSNAIFSSNSNTRDWAIGKKDLSPEKFLMQFGSLKPCIHGSDCHSFEKLCKPDQDRFCWIKADTCFEGLKQIIFEPEERVRIQATNPEFRKNIYSLSSIRIRNSCINDALSIKEENIPLNSNLVAITGGKGSGKTALLDLVANCFEDRCRREGEDRNSFVQRIEEQKPSLGVEIGFIGEEIENFSKELTGNDFFRDSKITYLPQGMIEEYCGDQTKLNRMIEEIIFNNKEVKEKDYKKKFDLLRDQISKLVKESNENNMQVYELEEETTKEIESDTENRIRIKEGELKNKQDEVKKLTENMPESIMEKISGLQEAERSLVTTHSKLSDIRDGLEQLGEDLHNFLASCNNTINELNNQLSDLSISITIPQLDFKLQLALIEEELLKLILQKTGTIGKQIDEKRGQLSQLSGVERMHVKLLEEIDDIRVDLNGLGAQLKQLKEKKAKIKVLDDLRIQKYQALINNYLEWKEYYKEVMNTFSIGKSAIMGDIDFESIIDFGKERFVELGSDILDQRRINTTEIEKFGGELENMIAENPQEIPLDKIEEFIEKISKKKKLLKATRSNYDFYKWIFGNYFSLSTKVLFKGRIVDKLSMGQKGTVLLKLFLAEGDYPLIIDQPEESLDNKFVYDELVGAFREAKKKRQIIIATNNANLVVNADAEQIIVAEFENNMISYNSGTLENLEMRKDIMPILEGSEEAFRKRGKKYGI